MSYSCVYNKYNIISCIKFVSVIDTDNVFCVMYGWGRRMSAEEVEQLFGNIDANKCGEEGVCVQGKFL